MGQPDRGQHMQRSEMIFLLYAAPTLWTTAQRRLVTTIRPTIYNRARAAGSRAVFLSAAALVYPFPPDSAAEPHQRSWLVTARAPDGWREDYDSGTSLIVKESDWWRTSTEHVTTNFGDSSSIVVPAAGAALMLDPTPPLTFYEIEPSGEINLRSRRGTEARALRRKASRASPVLLAAPSNELNLVVDYQRGILLRLEQHFQGEAFEVIEVVDIDIDLTLDDAVFSRPPTGLPVRDSRDWTGDHYNLNVDFKRL